MHDDAIAKRTKLRLTSDTIEVEQAQQAIQLRCKQERSEQEQQLGEAAKRHAMSLQELDHKQKIRQQREVHEAALSQQRLDNDEELRRLAALKELSVDLTKLLVAENEARPDRHVRIDAALPPTVHLHDRS